MGVPSPPQRQPLIGGPPIGGGAQLGGGIHKSLSVSISPNISKEKPTRKVPDYSIKLEMKKIALKIKAIFVEILEK